MASAGGIAAAIASKTKTKKKHFVAQKVKLFRASDPLLSVMMWGVNHSVSPMSLWGSIVSPSPLLTVHVLLAVKTVLQLLDVLTGAVPLLVYI